MPKSLSIPFYKPNIGSREITAVNRILKSGWLTTGHETMIFEKEFAAFLGNGSPGMKEQKINAVAVNSATAGLHLALIALEVGPGDKIAIPTMTFTATAGAVRHTGADPVFIDSCPKSGNMDPNGLYRVRNRIKAVIPVHIAGHPCNVSDIRQAVGESIPIVEDAAHAFPSWTEEGMIGTLGDLGVFSFYATKPITTGEGGMVVCREEVMYNRIKLLRLHGIDRPIWDRYNANSQCTDWDYDVTDLGYKYNMTDLAAAIGRVQLSRTGDLLKARQRLVSWYASALKETSGIELPEDIQGHAWHLYIVKLPSKEIRDKLAHRLHSVGIGTSVHFKPLHRMSYWKKTYKLIPEEFPVAENLADRILSLPLWPGLKKSQVEYVASIILELFNEKK